MRMVAKPRPPAPLPVRMVKEERENLLPVRLPTKSREEALAPVRMTREEREERAPVRMMIKEEREEKAPIRMGKEEKENLFHVSFSCGNRTRIFRLFENLYCQRIGNIFVSAFEEGIDLKSPFFVNF